MRTILSGEFISAMARSSSIEVACEHCGRVHFSLSESCCFEDGKADELREKQRQEPEKYIEHVANLHYGRVGGKVFVIGCPCNKAVEYENLYWNDRHLIVGYFVARAEFLKKRALEEHSLAQKLVNSLD